MSRRSDYGRKSIAYDIGTYGIVRTHTEKKRILKKIRIKKLQKKARKANRG